ncbi:hypothetical protein SAMN06295905_3047 [Devosia lucknowensis]|uniref:YCII-related domain-containing protein n=1 Tax=Devosia lucknowensis TaxID=1096929 RepID=A0A1Y6GBB5_9HYPH|nr:hypothetical protein [Devosia lucknowensis]SMQ85757.1 hypothetical protein SAMN06295905_3047 [Devosia lucknowensis]
MPLFLAVYMMKGDNVVRFRAMPKAEQDAVDNAGLPQWADWEKRNAASIVNKGGMVGKTTRVSIGGIAPASNDICGYVIVEADSAEDAAALFRDHPHFNTFPGDSVDIMPFVTEPDL